ncbi:methionine adenosyltransferase 2 subunit beta-like [Octopus sinensis]|uniref:Methionine adenosyltransferase 2 subunit beta n=1 Tax=Octopus sinensis TaxID=2607531 RepID=A0A7E6FRV4_9MOLL|nr:methionine adenosyltransferase 2 subunit beta-like [Octopus sinensis]
MVEIFPTHVKDVYICHIKQFKDHRGKLCELFNMAKYPEEIKKFFPIQQITCVTNRKFAHRGLHIAAYSKLLTCIKGSVYDVVVDTRPDSSTYLQWVGVTLSEENGYQLLVPPDCGHGYLALEEGCAVVYCQGGCFLPSVPEKAVHLFDKAVSIDWPFIDQKSNFLISEKDSKVPFLEVDIEKFKPNRKRILIISSKGQVGSTFYRLLKECNDKYVVIGTCHTDNDPQHYKFDLEIAGKDPAYVNLLLDACKPHVVIVCGAMVNANLCESQTELAYLVNRDSIEQLGKQIKKRGAKLIFFSTNYIFSDPLKPDLPQDRIDMLANDIGLKEDAHPNSVNVYGKSKLASENIFQDDVTNVLIIRISGVFGPDIKKRNFVYQVIGNLLAGNKMTLLTDEIQCPVYTLDLCRATLELMEKNCSGIYHVAGPEAFNKYTFGVKIAEIFNLDTSLLVPMSSEELKLPAKRPYFAALSTAKFRKEVPEFKFHNVSAAIRDWQSKENKNGKILPEF